MVSVSLQKQAEGHLWFCIPAFDATYVVGCCFCALGYKNQEGLLQASKN